MSDPLFPSRERVNAYNLLDTPRASFSVAANRVTEQTTVVARNPDPSAASKPHHASAAAVGTAAVATAAVVTDNPRAAKVENHAGAVVPAATLPSIESSPMASASIACGEIQPLSEAKPTQPAAPNALVVASSHELGSGVLLLPPASATADNFDLQEDHAMMEPLKQAYIFLSECNRQELRKIARRWNCPQGFTKGVLVAKLTMFVYEQVEKNKACGVADILGAVEDWGYDGFLAQWNSVHSEKSFPSLSTLQKLSRCNTKTDADAALPELPKPSGKRKWRKTRMREREEALHGTCHRPAVDRQSVKRTRSGGSDAKSGRDDSVATGLQTSSVDMDHGNSARVIATPASGHLEGPNVIANQASVAAPVNPAPVNAQAAQSANIPDVSADANAVDPYPKVDVSERVIQYIKMHMGDAKSAAPALRGRGSVAVKAGNAMTSSDGASRNESQMDIETERKLLLELKQAKKEMEAAKGDKELEERWKAFADRIRKKLDSVEDHNSSSALA